MNPQQQLNALLAEWDKQAEAFAAAAQDSARARWEWEHFAARERARLKAAATAAGEKLTVADLKSLIIEADTDALMLAAELSDAVVTGARKRLDVFQARADALRSEIASERERARAWAASPSVPEMPGAPAWG